MAVMSPARALRFAMAIALVGLSGCQATADRSSDQPRQLPTTLIERRAITRTAVVRASIVAAGGSEFVLGPPGDGPGRVTAVNVAPGTVLHAGDVLASIDGRPVFVFEGDLQLFRPINPGSEGVDVALVQRALASVGLPVGAEGTYDAATMSGVELLYRRAGFAPELTSSQIDLDFATALIGVSSARRALDDARTAATAASPSASGTPDPAAGVARRNAVAAAEEQLAAAELALAALTRTSGPIIRSGELLFVPTLPATVAAIDLRVGGLVGPTASGDTARTGPPTPSLRLTSGAVVAVAAMGPGQRAELTDGQEALIEDAASGTAFAAVVDLSATPPPAASTEGVAAADLVVLRSPTLPPTTVGSNLRTTITTRVTDGAVTAVPVAAVDATSPTSGEVVVVAGDRRKRVSVQLGASGDGWIGVDGSGLEVGDRVLLVPSS